MSNSIKDSGALHFRPEVHTDGEADKPVGAEKADKKGAAGTVADKKAAGIPTGDEVVVGQASTPPAIPQNLRDGTPQPPDDVKNVGSASNNRVDYQNAMRMFDQMADISFVLRDIKETKREDSMQDLKEVAKQIDSQSKDLAEFNDKFEEVASLLIQEFAAGRDDPQFCKQQMGPQDQNQELMKLLTEKLGVTPAEASNLLNSVREGNSSGLATALGLAAMIAMAEMRDEGDPDAAGKDPQAQGATLDPAAPNAGSQQGAVATTGEVEGGDLADPSSSDVSPTEAGSASAASSASSTEIEAALLGDGSHPPSAGLVDNVGAAHSMQGLLELFPGGVDGQDAIDPSAPMSDQQVMAAGVQSGFSVDEIINLAGMPPEQIMSAIKEKDEKTLNELKAKFGKMIRELVTANVATKALELSMKTAKNRIQQVFKPQLDSQPTRRLS
jgi:hypothetical protein